MMTHDEAVVVLQAVMDAGNTGWLRSGGAMGWWVWWEEPGLLVPSLADFRAWLPLVRSGVDPLGEVQHGRA